MSSYGAGSHYGTGWVGPGAKTSGMNAADQEQYKELKRHLEAEEQVKKDKENERRVSLGQKPLKDGAWIKVKKQFKRMMM